MGEQLLALAQRRNDTSLLQEAHWAIGQTHCYFGELEPARRHLEQSSSVYVPQLLNSQASRDAAGTQIACLVHHAYVLWALGYPDRALETSKQALLLAHELSHPFTLAFALYGKAWINLFRREAQATLKQSEAVIALANEQGFSLWMEMGNLLQAWSLAMQGHSEEGLAQMEQSMANKPVDAFYAFGPWFYALFVEAYGATGKTEEGLIKVAEGLDLVEKGGFRFYEAELHRLHGELLLMQSVPDVSLAETCLQRALDLAGSQQAKSLELRAAMDLSRIWGKQSRNLEALKLLRKNYDWFTEGFDTADLKEAKSLLEDLSNR